MGTKDKELQDILMGGAIWIMESNPNEKYWMQTPVDGRIRIVVDASHFYAMPEGGKLYWGEKTFSVLSQSPGKVLLRSDDGIEDCLRLISSDVITVHSD